MAKEVGKPAKSFKPSVSTQETFSTPSQPDWSGMQAYYDSWAHQPPFATLKIMSSPAVYPYTLGNQHQMMQQYGSLLQYQALYHQQYGQGATLTSSEKEERNPNEKDLDLIKNCKGSSKNMVLLSNRSSKSGNAASGHRNDGDGASQSAASGSEGSSDESDEANHDISATKKQRFNQMHANGAVAKDDVTVQYCGAHPDSVLQDSAVNMAETSGVGARHMMEEHELKKERRKQSNRESARRSKLRRKLECEKLQEAVAVLTTESSLLSKELQRLSEECEKLNDENKFIMDELAQMYGPDAISNLVAVEPDSVNVESNKNEKSTTNENNSNSDQSRNSLLSSLKLEAGSN